MLVALVLIIIALNYGIYEKEQIIKYGEPVFLKLMPRDPRSLLQGDYMRLYYAIVGNIPKNQHSIYRGYLVIRTNDNKVAEFVRVYRKQETLVVGEKLLRYHNAYYFRRIVPDSFLFQEGHAKYYENAKYGVFKFKGPDKYLLVGLADENMQEIKVNK
jgi:uncharacterized membrane-anchored protein